MTVRDTSAESHALNGHDAKKHQIRVWVREHGPCTRRMISKALGFDTATVSGMITPLLNSTPPMLFEIDKAPCPITGRNVYWLESAVEQLRIFA